MGDIWIHKNVAFFGDKWGKRKNGKQKTPHQKGCFCLAQRRGFEPPVRFRRTHDFQSRIRELAPTIQYLFVVFFKSFK